MTDFLFAVIAGLLFLTIEVNQEAQAMRSKSTPPPDSAVAVAGTEVRLRALETSAQELKSDLAGLAKVRPMNCPPACRPPRPASQKSAVRSTPPIET
jgi:hypothetical protein